MFFLCFLNKNNFLKISEIRFYNSENIMSKLFNVFVFILYLSQFLTYLYDLNFIIHTLKNDFI